MRALAELAGRIAELERRVSGIVRHGTVAEVDPAKGLMRMDMGEATGGGRTLSAWVPYSQVAGALKAHIPPTVGQQFSLVSPSGDVRQSVAMPMTWSDQNASPSGAGDENIITYGQATIALRGAELVVTVGGSTVTITPGGIDLSTSGDITMNAASIKLNAGRIDLN